MVTLKIDIIFFVNTAPEEQFFCLLHFSSKFSYTFHPT